ncbi:hypothetical protein J4434_06630 [Candidatus Woesearchaeota archaeon]|nr:hypothetical protein [Candidatus Woesearchaeota archaeon]
MRKQNFSRYFGFNLEEQYYESLRNEAFSQKMDMSELLRQLLKNRYGAGEDGKVNV